MSSIDDYLNGDSYDEITNDSISLERQSDTNESFTKKFVKKDLCINNNTIEEASKKIRAFDVIGPAYYVNNDIFFKIHKYAMESHGLEFKLKDGYIYPFEITPEGKNRMTVDDYVRGLK